MVVEMARYLLAELIIDIHNRYDFLERQCADYLYNGNAPEDFTVRVTDVEIQQEQTITGNVDYDCGYLESVCTYRKIGMKLPLYDAMLLHAAVISCDGKGIAFLARSGVGKTTHTLLWKRIFQEQLRIVNGDKPIVRFFDGAPYAYGTPWAGKENLQCNERVQLTDICFIERSLDNSVLRVDPMDYIDALMQQVLLPSEMVPAEKTLELLDKMVSNCKFWVIRCNVCDDAAMIAYNTIFGDG